jgi:DNA polymerase-4
MGRIGEHILHVDMDAFFVEVERRRDPTLHGVAVVVGGLGDRGVVAAASYEARRAGVRSAMPITEARRRLPWGRFLVPDRDAYRASSARVFEILESFSPIVERLSIDEAFLDIDGLGLHYTDAAEVAAAVRAAIKSQLDLPASAGAATTKLLAKLASEAAKPDGQVVIPAGSELEFLHPLEVRALWGVGEATYAALEGLGVSTVGELADLPQELLRRRLGDGVGSHLWALSRNIDNRAVTPGGSAKSISAEETFDSDVVDPGRIDEELFRLCAGLSARLRRSRMAARTIAVKVRFGDFSTVTRSHTGEAPIDLGPDLYAIARDLVDRAGVADRPVRLLGVVATGLIGNDEPRQLGLGDDTRQALAAAADDIRRRFGGDAVRPARLLGLDVPKRNQGPQVY